MCDQTMETSITFPHIFQAEGTSMKVKHTHPTYADYDQRMERLRDLNQSCRALLQKERKGKRVS